MPGLRYVRTRPDLIVILCMALVLGLFGPNITLFASAMAVRFGYGAEAFGLLSSAMAIGAIATAVLTGRAERPNRNMLIWSTAGFGVTLLAGAIAPTIWWFGLALVFLGGTLQVFLNTAHAFIQLTTPPGLRGRVLALFIAVSIALAPLGSVILGMVVNGWGAPAALVLTSISAFASSLLAVVYLIAFRGLRVRRAPAARVGFAFRVENPSAPVSYYGL